jgi:enoyl-CoA hydratase
MAEVNVRVEVEGPFATVTVDRPKLLNALDTRTLEELEKAAGDLAQRADLRGVIVTGAGEKAFVAGADIAEMQGMTSDRARHFGALGQRVMDAIAALPMPVVAAVNGFALGGGCELALACTVRIAVDRARIGLPEINLGTMPGYGGTQRLARLIPRGIAMELVTTGRILSAQEALALGLVNMVASPEDFPKAVDEMARLFLKKPAFSLKACMEAVNHGTEMSFENGLRLEATLFAMTCGTEDMKEGMNAFLEKREAGFKGL